jgi:hypothetical protein
MNDEKEIQILKNAMVFLERADLKGSESQVFNEVLRYIINKINELSKEPDVE